MSKIKWFYTDFGIPFEALCDEIKSLSFDSNEEESCGFRVQKKTDDCIISQFIEKETFIERIDLPNGDLFEERRSKIVITDLKIYKNKTLKLELYDPPRSTLNLMNKMSELTGQEMVCSPIEIDVKRWIENLEDSGAKLIVTALDCNGVRLSDGVVGRFALKGNVDVREDLLSLIDYHKGTLESARLNIIWDEVSAIVDVYRTGAIKGISLRDECVLDKIRSVTELSWVAD